MHSRGIPLLVSLCCAIITADQHVENVAMGKTYNQSSAHGGQGPSSNAANGNTSGYYDANNCIHTLSAQQGTQWWQVDLGGTYPVYTISVWGRTEPNAGYWKDRLYPFTITVDGQTCVSVTSAASNRKNSVTCSSVMYGRVVRLNVTMTGRILNLCEFQIFVCKEGFYGHDCSSPCDSTCDGGCTRTDGHCTRCKPGFSGPHFCHGICPAKCTRGTCQRATGDCNGCKSGFFGKKCTCNANCEGGCNSTNGDCTACPNGQYGKFCNMSCSPGCGQCDQDYGNCTACKDNLIFPDCSECLDGYYKQSGPPCIQCPGTCYNNSPCDKTTGHCDECPPGKKGDTCNDACDGGQYGPSRCSLSCGQCEDRHQCHPVTGHCARCQPGFYPPLCSTTCDDDTYGQNCSESCGQCKGGQPCNTTTGSCTTGCEPGYTGELCNDKCQPGFYGEGCSRPCGYCQVNTTCHHQDGHCLAGCVSGFAEPLCLQVQVKQESWVVPVVGSLAAALLICIGLVAIVCWCRRSREETEENHQRVAPPVEPESTQDPHHPSSASPISDADTTVYEIIDNADAEEMHVKENNYESPHPYSNDDADRALYMQLSPPASDEAS